MCGVPARFACPLCTCIRGSGTYRGRPSVALRADPRRNQAAIYSTIDQHLPCLIMLYIFILNLIGNTSVNNKFCINLVKFEIV